MAGALASSSAAMAGMVRSCRVAAQSPVAGKAFLRGAAISADVRVKGQGHRRTTVMAGGYDVLGASYANALVELAQSKNSLEAVHADVDALQQVLKDNESMTQFLYNPIVGDDKKKKLLADLAKEAGLNQYTLNFLNVLLDKGRIDALDTIFEAFEQQYCKLTDTQVATLRSAVKLEQEQQFLIAKKLQELTGSKNIKLKPVIDEELIAGFVVEYGSSQIDLSVKGQLDKITSELQTAALST